MRFFYKLDGIDSDWVDAGSRRTAFYPYLPAGEYRFVVRALSADGKWSEQDASVQLNIEPHFWETWAFYILCGVIVIVLGLTAVRIKTAQLENRNLLQREFSRRLINAHEKERQRIARELHDGLGQSLLLIKNWASLGRKPDVPEEELRIKLAQISETAGGSLDETRAILNDLSPQHVQRFGLTASIQQMIEQVQNSTGIMFESELDDLSGAFSYDSEISIYRIVQEALNNIVKHSKATHATIGITRNGETVEIRIRDFGKGINGSTGTSGIKSLGLESMRQRVNLMGGTLRIESGSTGTQLHISLNGLSRA
jgi:signal transduction histidine kinase